MADLLFEIGVEEIPAGYLAPAAKAFLASVSADLKAFAGAAESAELYWTPRRIAIIWRSLNLETESRNELVTGPPARIAWEGGTPDGKPSKALEGFCRKNGLTADQLILHEGPREPLAAAQITVPAEQLADNICAQAGDWIRNIPFPKSMVWDDSGIRFARPIRWLTVMLDKQVVPVSLGALKAGNTSLGHRQASFKAVDQKVEVRADNWLQQLRSVFVEADQNVREALIKEGIRKISSQAGISVEENPALLAEVINICEWPVVCTGSFDKSYLALPPEVIRAPLTKHQRYFSCVDDADNITNTFVFVSNSLTENTDVVSQGNEKVLEARLRDAQFFWDEDRKTTLHSRLDQLGGIIFHASLGSYADKIAREKQVANAVSSITGIPRELLLRATELAYADLVTDMVFEFPEVEGIMGRYYATLDGEDEAVVTSLEEGQMPRFADDALPSSDLGWARAVVARIETLASFFAAGIKPTGSKDPYALRRVAIALNRLLADRGGFDFAPCFKAILPEDTDSLVYNDIALFLATRWEKECAGEEVKTGEIRATSLVNPLRPDLSLLKAKILGASRAGGQQEKILDTFKRLHNLLEKNVDATDEQQLSASSSEELINTILERRGEEASALDVGDAAVSTLKLGLSATQPEDIQKWFDGFDRIAERLNRYFDTILVLDSDLQKRSDNLRFLRSLREVFRRYAAFEQLIF